MKKSIILLAACLSPGIIMADSADAPVPNSLDSRDAIPRARILAQDLDQDGYVSREEALGDPDLSRDFDKRDNDADGRLSETELAQQAAPPQITIPLPGTADSTGEKKTLGITITPATPPDSGLGIGP